LQVAELTRIDRLTAVSDRIALSVDSPSLDDGVWRYARPLLAATMTGALAATAWTTDRPLSDPRLLGILALGGVLVALVFGPGQSVERTGSTTRRALYFGGALGVAAALLALLAALGTFGLGWLLLVPLVAQARIALGAPGTAVVAVAALALLAGHAAVLGGLRAALDVSLGVGAGFLFVVFFTDFALRASRARAESERLRGQLEGAHRRLAAFALQAEDLAAERERTRLARELHDSLGHYLTVVGVQLEAAALAVDARPTEARDRITRAIELTRRSLAEVRRSVGALRAAPLAGRTLPEALEGLAREAAGDLAVELTVDVPDGEGDASFPPEVALTLFRVAQEGLTNVRKHAHASRAFITLRREGCRARLTVADDGVGISIPKADSESSTEGGFGLTGLRERVTFAGGSLRVESAAGRGLTLEAEVPI